MTAAKAIRPQQPNSVHNMTDGQLADEHRGCGLGKWRYEQKLKEIEAELKRRGLSSAQGERAIVSLQIGDIGLVDLKRLRADLGENICREYAIPNSHLFWRSIDRTDLTERGSA